MAFALHCLFSLPSAVWKVLDQACQQFIFPFLPRPQIPNIRKAPDHEVRVFVNLADASMAQLEHAFRERRQLLPRRQVHALKAHSPGNDVRNKVRKLNAGRQVAVDKQRFWQNLARSVPSARSELEVAVHLGEQQMALHLVEFVEHHNPVRRWAQIFQVIEEPLDLSPGVRQTVKRLGTVRW